MTAAKMKRAELSAAHDSMDKVYAALAADLAFPAHFAGNLDALWDTLLRGEEWHGEFHNRRKDGDLYWCLESISPVKDASGAITHFVAVT